MTQGKTLAVKRAVRERDGYRCTECRMTNIKHLEQFGFSLDVHRITPGSEYSLEGCVAVCRSCHSRLPKRAPGESGISFFCVRLPAAYHAALKELARANRRTLVAEMRIALDDYIRSQGFVPPTV